MSTQTTSFKIAQYILMFLVALLCIGIIIWIFTAGKADKNNNSGQSVDNVIRITNTDPCVQQVNNAISQLWAYNIDSVPEKYINIANNYVNEQITVHTSGVCNDVNFVCRPGQIRRDCDPCAIGSGRQFAMQQQINDEIEMQCK